MESQYSVTFIKNEARKLKKNLSDIPVSHTEALNMAAIKYGFKNYNDFLKTTKQ